MHSWKNNTSSNTVSAKQLTFDQPLEKNPAKNGPSFHPTSATLCFFSSGISAAQSCKAGWSSAKCRASRPAARTASNASCEGGSCWVARLLQRLEEDRTSSRTFGWRQKLEEVEDNEARVMSLPCLYVYCKSISTMSNCWPQFWTHL